MTPTLDSVPVILGGMVWIAQVRLSFFLIFHYSFPAIFQSNISKSFHLQNLIAQRMACAQIKEHVKILQELVFAMKVLRETLVKVNLEK